MTAVTQQGLDRGDENQQRWTPGLGRAARAPHARARRLGDHRDPLAGRRDRRHHVLRRVPRARHVPDPRPGRHRRPADRRRAGGGAAVLGHRGPGQRPRLRLRAAGGRRGPGPRRGRADDHQRRHRLHGTAGQELHRPGRRRRRRGADLPRRADGVPRLRGRRARRAARRRRDARRRARRPAGRRAPAEDRLHDPRLPEPDRPVDERGAPAGAGRPGPPLRLPDPGGRGLPRARLRRRREQRRRQRRRRRTAEHVVAGARRRAAGGHVLQDLLARIPDGLGGRARPRSSAGWSSPSRTPTSARARSASGCSRSTAGAVTWTGRSPSPGCCTGGERA